MLENFYLEIKGLVCETAEDEDNTECFSTFDTGQTLSKEYSGLGKRYGADIISLNDIIKRLPNDISLEQLSK